MLHCLGLFSFQPRKETYSNSFKLKKEFKLFHNRKVPALGWLQEWLEAGAHQFHQNFIFLHLLTSFPSISQLHFPYLILKQIFLYSNEMNLTAPEITSIHVKCRKKKKQDFTRISLITGFQRIWLCHASIPKLNTEVKGWSSLKLA